MLANNDLNMIYVCCDIDAHNILQWLMNTLSNTIDRANLPLNAYDIYLDILKLSLCHGLFNIVLNELFINNNNLYKQQLLCTNKKELIELAIKTDNEEIVNYFSNL